MVYRYFSIVLALALAAPAAAEPLTEAAAVIEQAGTTTVVTLSDLADGGSRSFVHGGKTVQVKREGAKLSVLVDGKPILPSALLEEALTQAGQDAPCCGGDPATKAQKKIVVMKKALAGDLGPAAPQKKIVVIKRGSGEGAEGAGAGCAGQECGCACQECGCAGTETIEVEDKIVEIQGRPFRLGDAGSMRVVVLADQALGQLRIALLEP